MNRHILYLNCFACMLLMSTPLHAQKPLAVPVPSQFATAHTVFLACGGAPAIGSKEKLVSNMIYESMYRALAAQRQYQLELAPNDVDLAMEVSIVVASGATPDSFGNPSLRLAVFDRKTHALLWTLDQPLKGAWREKTFQHNIDDAAGKLVEDLKSLAAGKVPQS